MNQPFYTPYNAGQPIGQPNWNQPVLYPPMQNQMPQTVNTQPTPQPINRSVISGRVVSSEEEIIPNEVPGDGTISVFPVSDGSKIPKILVKHIAPNGLITTSVYELATGGEEKETQVEQSDILNPILERLDNIEKMIKKGNNRYYKKRTDTHKEDPKSC